MRDGATVVFVEVRQRRSDRFGGAAASVDRRKCGRIARAASAWLVNNPAMAKAPCRFDVLALSGRDADVQIDWIRDAFTLDDVRCCRTTHMTVFPTPCDGHWRSVSAPKIGRASWRERVCQYG